MSYAYPRRDRSLASRSTRNAALSSSCELPFWLCRKRSIGATDLHKINLFLNSRGAVVEETFRLDLNQSWEAIDIKTGQAVLIPKGPARPSGCFLKARAIRQKKTTWWSRSNRKAT